tara:strand:- start:506 stop:805 length:300 start_codon:yes stop_codon:yes gene_type:complete
MHWPCRSPICWSPARRGDGALAVGYATIASFIGGVFSLVVLVILAPQLAKAAADPDLIEKLGRLNFVIRYRDREMFTAFYEEEYEGNKELPKLIGIDVK